VKQKSIHTKQASTKVPAGKEVKEISAYVYGLLPLLLACLAMGGAVWNDFVEWDDNKYVYDNTDLGNWTIAGWKYILGKYVMGNWHPLTMLSFSLEYTFWGNSPGVYHFTNIAFHALNSVLVFILAMKLFQNRTIALWASALFAVHPLHVESVAWISERKDVLYVFFTLLALNAWIQFRNNKENKYFLYSLLFFFLACTSKAQAVVFPLLAFGIDYYTSGKKTWRYDSVKYLIPHFILALIIGIVAIDAQAEGGNVRVFRQYTWLDQVLIGIQGYLLYLFKTFIPYAQSAYYPYPVKDGVFLPWYYYVSPFVFSGMIWALFRWGKVHREIVAGFLFFTIALLPVLQILPVGETMISERYYYLPSVGLFLLAGWGIVKATEKYRGMNYVFGSIVMIFLYLCIQRVQVWNNTFSLFLDVMQKHDNVPVAYNNIANQFTKEKQYERAIPLYKHALSIRENYPIGWHNLGNNYTHTGQFILALNAFEAYMRIRPDDGLVYKKIGTVYSKMGTEAIGKQSFTQAEEYFLKAIEHDPDLSECYVNLGNLNAMRQSFDGAEKYYRIALQLNPENNGTWFNQGLMFMQSGRSTEGLQSIRKSASLGNQNAVGWLNQYAPENK